MKFVWDQVRGRSWSRTALLIRAFNPLKSLISTWLGEVNSLIPVSVWRWVLVYFSSKVMQSECVWVQQWVGVPEDCAEAEAVFVLRAAGGIRCRRQHVCSLLLSLQRVTSRWLHSDADTIDTANSYTVCTASSVSSVTWSWHCWQYRCRCCLHKFTNLDKCGSSQTLTLSAFTLRLHTQVWIILSKIWRMIFTAAVVITHERIMLCCVINNAALQILIFKKNVNVLARSCQCPHPDFISVHVELCLCLPDGV